MTADLYKLLFDETRDGMWVINPGIQKIIDVNKALMTLSGYTREELLAMPPQNISPDPEGTAAIMKKALGKCGEIFMERLVKTKAGRIIPVEISGRSATIAGQRLLISVFRDIRDRQRLDKEKNELIDKLEQALEEVKKLSGLLPICSSCKKIRDEDGQWNQLEGYLQTHSEVMFSHGLCPDCMAHLYRGEPWYDTIKDCKD